MEIVQIGRAGVRLVTAAAVVAVLAGPRPARALSEAAQRGEEIFRKTCFACHTVGGGRLVGPDLRGVTERRREEWLVRFVQNSTDMVASGDAEAVAIFEEYARIPMPPQALSAAEVLSVLAFTKEGEYPGPVTATAAATAAAAPAPPSDRQIALGRALFQGTQRLINGGPTCNSCHEVSHDAVIGGGLLARDLTTVFSRLGGPGVRSVIGSPPFPVMQRAYQDRPLTQVEQAAILAFLEDADAQHAFQRPRDYGIGLFTAGTSGAIVLLGLYSLLWRRRRIRTVYESIFDRQVRST